ncbi:MAG: PadR family transcriptional regulator [Bacteroidota bacterium]
MKRVSIGEFEELCLLVAGILGEDAYGISVKREVEVRSGRSVTISTIHATLIRLEKKGLLASRMGGASESRGGRAKRLFELTAAGKQAILEVRDLRNQMWKDLPNVSWDNL